MNHNQRGFVTTGMNRIATLAGAAVAAVILASCSSSGGSSAPATTKAAAAPAASSSAPAASSAATTASGITISNFAYSGTMTVKAGQKVTVTNNDTVAHTLTDKATHKFDTGNINGNGGTGTFTAPSKPGTYKFGCTYHPNMAGTLTVTA
jgi:plastocyanin